MKNVIFSRKILVGIFIALITSLCVCIVQATSSEEEIIRYVNGEPWAWYKTNWQRASTAQQQYNYPIKPVYIIGDKEGEFLIYAHRKIICPYCDFVRIISFAEPFNKEYRCEKCNKIYDENIGLYKWQKSLKREERN